MTSIKFKFIGFLMLLFFLSCDDNFVPGGAIGESKQIEWELFHAFEEDENVSSFAISGNGIFIFYVANQKDMYRLNVQTGEKIMLTISQGINSGTAYLHYLSGILYAIYERENADSYFATSQDMGDTFTEHKVGTYTRYDEGKYDGAFMQIYTNRLFVMPNGIIYVPFIKSNTHNVTNTSDNQLVAYSANNGATWSRIETELSFIVVRNSYRLYALSEGVKGNDVSEKVSDLYYSNNYGASWLKSDLKYKPQTVDWNKNLIAGGGNELQRLKDNVWTIFQWDELTSPSIQPLEFINEAGVRRFTTADIEFDAENNIYVLDGVNRIYKSNLD